MENALVEKAKKFATAAHRGQLRNKILNSEYIIHPEEVAMLVERSGGNEIEVAAAWLHDTVEDTATTIADIRREFGDHVAEIVIGLTDLPEYESLAMEDRKKKQAERVAKEDESIRRIKLCDQISNITFNGGKQDTGQPIEHRKKYIEAAKTVANQCKGISPVLDALLEEQYKIANSNLGAYQLP